MNIAEVVTVFVNITDYFNNLYKMLKRRTSKRFVLGDTSTPDDQSSQYENEEATETIPSNVLQKFQMTLDAEPEKERKDSKHSLEQDGKFLRLPSATLT